MVDCYQCIEVFGQFVCLDGQVVLFVFVCCWCGLLGGDGVDGVDGYQNVICIGSLVGSCVSVVVLVLISLILVRQFRWVVLLLFNVQYGVNIGLLWIVWIYLDNVVLWFFMYICVFELMVIDGCSGDGRQICVQGCLFISSIVSGVLIGVWLLS